VSEASFRTLSPSLLLALTEPSQKPLRVSAFRDVLPSGHLVARMPAVVDWRRSQLDATPRSVLLRAINAGSNPLDRTVILHNARVLLDRIAYVEAIFVPLDATGISQHGQLRFVFEKGAGPALMTLAEPGDSEKALFEDLVLSWEPWRYQDDAFTMRGALDDAYPLTMRAYVGPQRFLEDALQGQVWHAYRLKLPGGRDGMSELLAVSLAVGDGVARQAMGTMMDQVETAWHASAPAGTEPDADVKAAWTKLRQIMHPDARPAEAYTTMSTEETTYNPLLRSCVGMMRYSILLAAHRLAARGMTDGVALDRLPAAALGKSQPWMRDAAHCNLRGVFARAPLALNCVFHNPQTLPKMVLEEIDAAGLIAHRHGKRDMLRYANNKVHPYGADGLKRRDTSAD